MLAEAINVKDATLTYHAFVRKFGRLDLVLFDLDGECRDAEVIECYSRSMAGLWTNGLLDETSF